MKQTLLTLLCAAALVLPAQAQNTPVILVVDVGAVFNGYSEAQAAQMRFSNAVEKANNEITDMVQQATALGKQAQDLDTKASNTALTQDARDGYKAQLADVTKQFQSAQVNIQSYKTTMEQQLQERRQAIVQQQFNVIKDAVIQVAQKRKATLVLNSSGLAVVYSDPSMDITKDVLQTLNAAAASAPGASTGGATPPAASGSTSN
ncbi:MAG: OmpH family outer membrane protein [Opitutales bacterium]|jgi:outer membrane protein